MAKKAEDKAPIKIRLALLRSIPRRIKEPSPPAPIKAARVAVPIIITAAVRIPGHDDGHGQGNLKLLESFPLGHPKGDPCFFEARVNSLQTGDGIFEGWGKWRR